MKMDDGAVAKRKGGKHGSSKPNAEAKRRKCGMMSLSRTAYNLSMAANSAGEARELPRSRNLCALQAEETKHLEGHVSQCSALVRLHPQRARSGRQEHGNRINSNTLVFLQPVWISAGIRSRLFSWSSAV